MNRLDLLLPLVYVLFFSLLGAGWYMGVLTGRRIAIFLAIWIIGSLAMEQIGGPFLRGAFAAIADIALVLIVFKRDIPLD